jgi:small subunit ribosomal protein S14
MAKVSKIARNDQRAVMVARWSERRLELKSTSVNPHVEADERAPAMAALHALPRDASPTRVRRRDTVDGRPRGFMRVAGVSRVRFRQMALRGELPGIRKSSW